MLKWSKNSVGRDDMNDDDVMAVQTTNDIDAVVMRL